jgi:Shedu protein SduA, C-terminal
MPGDPKTWTRDEICDFSESAIEDELGDVIGKLMSSADDDSIAVLCTFLEQRGGSLYEKSIPSQLAARALIGIGPSGVEALREALVDDDRHVRYAPAVLALLWEVSRTGALSKTTAHGPDRFLDLEVPESTREGAGRAVRDIFAQAAVDPNAFHLVVMFAQQRGLAVTLGNELSAKDMGKAVELMGLFTEATIKLTRSVLDEFRELIAEQRPEERYQQFLSANPVLLDPLAAEVIPKQSLGGELATDYAVRRHDDRWLLVEIERPQDHPFTKADDFNARFVHAFGQVLDFQIWVDSNVSYAQTLMAEIVAPRGMVVIGLRERMDEVQRKKLRRFVDNSQRIEIHTFDDLLTRAETLYESLHYRRK